MHYISLAILSRLSLFPSPQLAQIDLSVLNNQSINQSIKAIAIVFYIQYIEGIRSYTYSLATRRRQLGSIIITPLAVSLQL